MKRFLSPPAEIPGSAGASGGASSSPVGTSPKLTPNAALGSTGSSTLTAGSTDLVGSCTLTPGGSSFPTGAAATFRFTASLAAAPRAVLMWPANQNAADAQVGATGGFWVDIGSLSTAGFQISTSTSLSSSSGDPIIFYYLVVT